MDETKRRLWSSIAIRIFALLYLLYILYKLAVRTARAIPACPTRCFTWSAPQ